MSETTHSLTKTLERTLGEEADRKESSVTYLVFRVAQEPYACPVDRIDEVLEYSPPTFIPRSPPYLLGIVNVRGRLISVLDMRKKLGLPPDEVTAESRLVVMELSWNGETVPLAVLVDGVDGVVDVAPSALSPPPQLGRRADSAFLESTARVDDRILMVIDVDHVLAVEDLHQDFADLAIAHL